MKRSIYKPNCTVSIAKILQTFVGLGALAFLFGAESVRAHSKSDAELQREGDRGTAFYQKLTGDPVQQGQSSWDARYSTRDYLFGRSPARFLTEVLPKIPVGKALDIAMGEGRNAVYLAKKGFQVEGVDISDVALRKSRRLARENQVTIATIQADLNSYDIAKNQYDLIVNINYLQRSLFPQIKAGLKKGGYVVFETYTLDHLKTAQGKGMNREYLLEKEELKKAFSDFNIIVYRETMNDHEAVASLLAQKP